MKQKKNKDSKLEKFLDGIEIKPFDSDDWDKRQEKRKKEVKQEEKRIKNIKCPCCKSTKKSHVINSENNGIMGPGYHSRITDEYYLCLGCGVRYEDLNKKEIKLPKESTFYF